ncbi:cell division protein FtsQ/DivIB [Caldimonas tepidiphila]|uniref:cell division protein FtsQ/DivIB n=1 Tax=Caldimonas tepidiphila TaxID=2315841 RepID=UPI000E5B6CA9|nr:cell division protein FtsQ/DivIB [Caldimonas tepidiphila]
METATPLDVRLMNATSALLYAVAALACAALLLAWLVRLPMFSLRSITVEGEVSRNSVTTIRANALPRLVGNFFTLDLQDARVAFEAVPWVRRATVQRVWPDGLEVRLEEHEPVAQWGEDRLVNAQGEVFTVNLGDVEDEDLPMLSGPTGSAPRVLEAARRINAALDPIGREVKMLGLTDRGSWHLELDDGAVIELGRGSSDAVVARIERFAKTIQGVTSRYQSPLIYADLRHNSGYAVRLKGVTTTIAPVAKAKKN